MFVKCASELNWKNEPHTCWTIPYRLSHRHHRCHWFESRWRRLQICSCIYETTAEIVQKLWRSFLQFNLGLLLIPCTFTVYRARCKRTGRSTVQVNNIDNERFTVVVVSLNLEISRCYLVDYVKESYWSVCRTCSTCSTIIHHMCIGNSMTCSGIWQ